ncbi:MAG: chloramphenicol acetyltransferase [Lachnospiraceae bacterium]|nr:chloramphenicol acetyltransferase [Lachnospiraceae bacterium]
MDLSASNTWEKVDLEQWARREHYRYYTEKLKIEFHMTANVRVERLLDFCHRKGYRFYAVLIYVMTKTVNSIENLRMFRNEQGELCVWDQLNPNYTIFHDDDKTFSDCWSEYSENFETCYHTIVTDMETYRDVKGIKARGNQPANFYCVSCAPWTSFTGYGSRVADGEPQFFPVITAGKYERLGDGKAGGAVQMPVNLTIAHAVCDGYHAGLFFERLQEKLDQIGD